MKLHFIFFDSVMKFNILEKKKKKRYKDKDTNNYKQKNLQHVDFLFFKECNSFCLSLF